MTTRPTFTLTLVDAGRAEDGDAYRRLRAALKRLLRSYGFRCVRVVEVRPQSANAPGPPADADAPGRP